jgi:hypothetical protein
MFAPVNTLRVLTFSVVMLDEAVLSVRMFALKMFAKVVTESWVMFAPVNTLRVLTFSVVILADAVFTVRILAIKMFAKVVTES